MTFLCGAWSMDGRPVEASLPSAVRRRIRSLVGAGARGEELCRGPIWLAAAPGALASVGDGAAALGGFLAADRPAREELGRFLAGTRSSEGPAALGEGHYSLVLADAAEGRLSLWSDPSDGTPLYHCRVGELLLFSSSLKALLAHEGVSRALDQEGAGEFLLCRDFLSAGRTGFRDIVRLRPGHGLAAADGRVSALAGSEDYFQPPEPGDRATPERFRRAVWDAARLVLGRDRQAAVLLSGGLDSATVACAAADILGPSRVAAFTYEFDDPGHVSEAPAAAALCRHLGIRHEVVRIGYEETLALLPETVWRTEMPASPNIHHCRLLPVLGRMRKEGFSKALTGFGIIEVLGYLSHHDRYLKGLAASLTRRGEGAAEVGTPPAEIRFQVLSVLQLNGLIGDAADHYPQDLQALVRRTQEQRRQRWEMEGLADLPLFEQLRYAVHATFGNARLFQFKVKLSQEESCLLTAPAMLPSCAALFRHFSWRPDGSLPMGRALHREAMSGRLPQAVLERPKIPFQTIMSKSWYDRINEDISARLGAAGTAPAPGLAAEWGAASRRFPHRVAQWSLWRRVCADAALRAAAPDWDGLGRSA
ncbi:MAG: 7-cyano-7-deazaguanine synthase [Elusimicrobia bacterium]|nr:7-cyano-7-deazaguanine synthase [Elusimicrobiota bacterium]